MAVRGKRADKTGGGSGGGTGASVGIGGAVTVDELVQRQEAMFAPSERVRDKKPRVSQPVAASKYSVLGSDVPNTDYEGRAEEEDVQRELAALEAGRTGEEAGEEAGEAEGGDSDAGRPDDASTQLPVPPARNIQDPRQFFAYWGSLSQAAKDRVIVYVYRKWPVVNRHWCPECEENVVPPANKRMPCMCTACGWTGKITTSIDKLVSPIGVRDVIVLYGTGHYLFMMVDTNRGGNIVCSSVVRTEVDFRAYPPMITDKRDVVASDPTNRAYVEYLRTNKERLRGEKINENEDYQVAQMNDMVGGLVNKVIELSSVRARRGSSGRNRNAASGLDSQAINRITDVMAKTAQQSNEHILNAVEQARNMQGNPLDMVKQVFEIMKDTNKGKGGDGSQDVVAIMQTFLARDSEMNKSVLELYRKENEAQGKELAELKRMVMSKQTEPPKGIKEMLEEMAQLKSLVRDVMGVGEDGGGGGSREPEPFDWVSAAVKILPSVINGVVAVSYNLALAKANENGGAAAGVPSAGGAGPIAPISPVANPETGYANGGGSAAGLSGMPGAGGPGNGQLGEGKPQTEEEMQLGLINQYMKIFESVQPRILSFLQDPQDGDGSVFAEELVHWHNAEAYQQLHKLGEDNLKGLLLQWGSPELRALITAKPDQLDTFVHQFMTAFDGDGDDGQGAEEAGSKT